MSTFVSTFIQSPKNILIPIMQRDYVQGGRPDIINPLLDKIHDALTQEKTTVELNYIYGYDEGEPASFIAIDGQQRLITLWLVHLYLYSLRGENIPVRLTFHSRPSAQAFAQFLPKELPGLLKQNCHKIVSSIIESSQFITSWYEDTTVRNMLETLGIIDRWKDISRDTPIFFENVKFSFLDMEVKGLDDDVYLKMNGRGRPLSYFENLKSWMDEQVEQRMAADFVSAWKESMDGKWAALFWENRNKGQDPPEIDNEQLRFFYSTLLLYWVRKREVLTEKIPSESAERNGYLFSSLCSFCEVNEKEVKAGQKKLPDEVLRILQKGKNKLFSLYWIESLSLFDKYVFKFIKSGLDRLCDISASIPSLKVLFPGVSVNDKTSILYHLAFEEATYEQTLPLLYALMRSPYKDSIGLYHWIRTIRNLVLNSSIGLNNIRNVLWSIDILRRKCHRGQPMDIYSALTDNSCTNKLKGFHGEQLKEEILKASVLKDADPDIINKAQLDAADLASSILYLENLPQFQGQIRFMFNILGEPCFTDNYKRRFSVIGKIISLSIIREKQEIKTAFGRHLFRRALITFEPHYFGRPYGNSKWQHIQGSQWKEYISADKGLFEGAECFKNLILDLAEKVGTEIAAIQQGTIERLLEEIVKPFEQTNRKFAHYWEHFARHSDIWSFMEQKLTNNWKKDDKNINIDLIQKTNIGPIMELRTYSLFLDIRQDGVQTLKDYFDSWDDPRKYLKEGSCFYFEKMLSGENKLFMDVWHGRKKEDDYHICYSFRQKKNETTLEKVRRQKKYLGEKETKYFKPKKTIENGEETDFRMTSESLSRDCCISLLKKMLESDCGVKIDNEEQ